MLGRTIIIIILMVGAVAACSNDPLLNTYWRIERLQDTVVPHLEDTREPYITFINSGSHHFSASIGCNQINGSYIRDGNDISFSPAASTMMACSLPLSEIEPRFIAVLPQIDHFHISDGILVFYSADGLSMLELRSATASSE